MDVRLSPEQQALRDSVSQACGRLAARAVGELDDVERAGKLDAVVEAAGWRELRVPDDGHAPLASAVEVAIVAEELGRSLADVAFLGPTLAVELRRLCGAPMTAAAETVALTSGLDTLAIATDTTPPSDAVAIDAGIAESALVLTATAGDGNLVAEVALSAPRDRPDLTRPAADLDPGRVVTLLGEPSRPLAPDDLTSWSALGLALTCADLVGTMRGAIDLSVEYASSRNQFGRPVGSFQAVQHMLADALVLMEGSRSAALHAAWAVDAVGPEDALAAASVAKAYCARSARIVCETAIQVHGGIGNTWECLAHVYLRRALLSSEVLGGAAASLDRVLAHNGIGGGHGLQ